MSGLLDTESKTSHQSQEQSNWRPIGWFVGFVFYLTLGSFLLLIAVPDPGSQFFLWRDLVSALTAGLSFPAIFAQVGSFERVVLVAVAPILFVLAFRKLQKINRD